MTQKELFNSAIWKGTNWATPEEIKQLRSEYPELQDWSDDCLCQSYSSFSELIYHIS